MPQSGVYAALGTDMQRGWELWLDRNGGKFGDYTRRDGARRRGREPADRRARGAEGAAERRRRRGRRASSTRPPRSACGTCSPSRKQAADRRQRRRGGRHRQGAHPLHLAHLVHQRPDRRGDGHAPRAVRVHRGRLRDRAGLRRRHRGHRRLHEGLRGRRRHGGRRGEAAVRQDLGLPAVPHRASSSSGAKATFCFFSGAEAITFVKQYAAVRAGRDDPAVRLGLPHRGQRAAAAGRRRARACRPRCTTATSSTTRPTRPSSTPTRRKYGEAPSCFAVQTYDAANVLNRALRTATALDGDALAAALGGVGTIDDSPRGPWTFDGQTPRQNIYLRKVENVGGTLVNAVVQDLGPQSQPAAGLMLGQRPQRGRHRVPAVHPGGRAVARLRDDGRAQPRARRAVPRRRLPRRRVRRRRAGAASSPRSASPRWPGWSPAACCR